MVDCRRRYAQAVAKFGQQVHNDLANSSDLPDGGCRDCFSRGEIQRHAFGEETNGLAVASRVKDRRSAF